jgi:hypothetical protein
VQCPFCALQPRKAAECLPRAGRNPHSHEMGSNGPAHHLEGVAWRQRNGHFQHGAGDRAHADVAPAVAAEALQAAASLSHKALVICQQAARPPQKAGCRSCRLGPKRVGLRTLGGRRLGAPSLGHAHTEQRGGTGNALYVCTSIRAVCMLDLPGCPNAVGTNHDAHDQHHQQPPPYSPHTHLLRPNRHFWHHVTHPKAVGSAPGMR